MVDYVDKNYTIYLNEQGPQGAQGPTGAKGETGATPDITMTASADNKVGTPKVEVVKSGSERYPVFAFAFYNLKGNGITSIEKTETNVLTDTYTITYENGETKTYEVENGNGIDNIAKTSTKDATDTYTITYTNGTTFTYDVVNGSDIESIAKTSTSGLTDTYTITLTDGTTNTFEVSNGKGINKIAKTATSGLTDTYTITYNDSTTSTFNVNNGRGINSVTKTKTSGKVDTYTIAYNDSTSSTFTVTNGNDSSVSIGSVTTGAAGTNAKVTNSGTSSNAVLNFTIPRGDTITEDALIGGDDVELDSSDDSINVGGASRIYDVIEDNDEKAFNKVQELKRSTFDKSKFTVVGSPTITEDGIASGFSAGNYISTPSLTFGGSFDFVTEFITQDISTQISPLLTINSSNRIHIDKDGKIAIFAGGNAITLFAANTITLNTNYLLKIHYDGIQTYTATLTNKDNGVSVTASKTLAYSLQSGSYYIGSDKSRYLSGSIDLKSFSITVDGVEVFNGNKGGIDEVKPDNYTIVGSPTISEDGVITCGGTITTGIKSSLTYEIQDKPFVYYSPTLHLNDTSVTDVLGGVSYTALYGFFTRFADVSRLWLVTYSSYNTVLFQWSTTGLTQGHTYQAKLEWDGAIYKYSMSTDGGEFVVVKTLESTTPIAFTAASNVLSGYWHATHYVSTNPLDLNTEKLYINGNLVYQPCLKVPYTLSQTGSKIVNANYRDRVQDVYDQYGTGNYYVLDETNKEVDLPRPDIYGLIASNSGGGSGATYTAGDGIAISSSNEISLSTATQTELTNLTADVASLDADKADTTYVDAQVSANRFAMPRPQPVNYQNNILYKGGWNFNSNGMTSVYNYPSVTADGNDVYVSGTFDWLNKDGVGITFDKSSYCRLVGCVGSLGSSSTRFWMDNSSGDDAYFGFEYPDKLTFKPFNSGLSGDIVFDYNGTNISNQKIYYDYVLDMVNKTAICSVKISDEKWETKTVSLTGDVANRYFTWGDLNSNISSDAKYYYPTYYEQDGEIKWTLLIPDNGSGAVLITPDGTEISAGGGEYQGGSYINIDNNYINWTYDANAILSMDADNASVTNSVMDGENGEKSFYSEANYNELTETYGEPKWVLTGGSYKVSQPLGVGSFGSTGINNGAEVLFGYGSSSPHLVYPTIENGGEFLTLVSSMFYSGDTAPSSQSAIWLDTTNMEIKTYSSSDSAWKQNTDIYLPIGIAKVNASDSNTGTVGFIQLFRPFSILGDYIFATGVRASIPYGRNAASRMKFSSAYIDGKGNSLGITAAGTYVILWDNGADKFKAVPEDNYTIGYSLPTSSDTYVYNLQDNYVYTKNATTKVYEIANVVPVAKITYAKSLDDNMYITAYEPCPIISELVTRAEAMMRGYGETSSSSEGVL